MHNRSICRAPAIRSVDRHRAQSRRSRAGRGCRQLRSVILLRAVSVRTGIYIGIRRVRGGETSTAGPESLSRRTRPVSALLSRAQWSWPGRGFFRWQRQPSCRPGRHRRPGAALRWARGGHHRTVPRL